MSKIKIFSLGGLNEIGKNMYVVDVDNDIFIFDAGLKYPDDRLFGVDYIIPNYDYIKENNEVRYNENVLESLEKANAPQVSADDEDDCDEFLTEAIELAVNMGQISASMIQRKFKVGYARAGRIVDQMEDRGIISGHQGSKPRQVLISKEEWEEMKEQGEDTFIEEEEYEQDNINENAPEGEKWQVINKKKKLYNS